MQSEHQSFGRGDEGLVTCRVYEDGDVVVCHGSRGNVENMQDVSGFGPILNMCDRLDISLEYEEQILGFVHEQSDLFS